MRGEKGLTRCIIGCFHWKRNVRSASRCLVKGSIAKPLPEAAALGCLDAPSVASLGQNPKDWWGWRKPSPSLVFLSSSPRPPLKLSGEQLFRERWFRAKRGIICFIHNSMRETGTVVESRLFFKPTWKVTWKPTIAGTPPLFPTLPRLEKYY